MNEFQDLYRICTEIQLSVMENDKTRKILDLCAKLQTELEKYQQGEKV